MRTSTQACHRILLAAGLLGGLLCVAAPALAQSIEDRLRSQLRTTTQQLRDLQDGQAQLQADKAQAEQQRDKAQADLKQAQADLAAAKGNSDEQAAAQRSLAAEKASHAKDDQQLAKYRSAYEDLVAQSRSHDAERTQAEGQLKTASAQLQTCEAKNAQLYEVGHEILDAYEHVGFGTYLKSREPFAQSARVKYDEIGQDFGDKLYAGKFDPRAAAAPASAPAASK
jgi:DNA repair exonuclease SbcCD ATPase subunit